MNKIPFKNFTKSLIVITFLVNILSGNLTEYQFIFSALVLEKFTTEFEHDLEDEYLTYYRYNYLYDSFLNQELEKVTYEFKN